MLKKVASLLVVPILLLLWARFGSANLATYSFNALSNYASPYLGALTPGKDGQAVSSQVVIFVIDALRDDTSRAVMPAVNKLRARGADRSMQVGQPSLSLPGWTVIGTGAWQEQTGVTLNFYTQDIKVDTIFEAAKRKGLKTAIVGMGASWKQLYTRGVDTLAFSTEPKNPYVDLAGVRKADDEIEATALKILREQKPNLLLIHLAEPDDAGHGYGAASEPYRSAATAEDGRIGRVADALDLNQATLIVTADHGMLAQGGHGGWEPEVLTTPFVAAGKGILPGQYPSARQADIAPTLAVLLGTSISAHNQGQPLFDSLDIPAALRAARAVDTAQEVNLRNAQLVQVLGGPAVDTKKLDEARQALAAGQYDAAVQAARADIQSSTAQFAAAREARYSRERMGRLPVALLILLPFLAYLVIYWRAHWDWRIPLAGLVVYNVVYNGLFFGRGLYWSFSIFNSEEQILSFFEARTIDAMIALLISALVMGLLCRKSDKYTTALAVVNMAFLVTAVLAVQILYFYVLYDITFPWYVPDMQLGLKYYLDVLQTGAFWPLTPVPLLVLLPFVALGARWVAAKIPVGGRKPAPAAGGLGAGQN